MTLELPRGLVLPDGWKAVRLGEIAHKIRSGATPKGGAESYLPYRSGYALIRSQNVFDHYFDESGLANISDDQVRGLAGAEVNERDVLLNITGDGVTFGRACIVPKRVLPACVNQHVMLIRLNQAYCLPEYLLAWLNLPQTKRYIESFNAGGSRRAITKGHIESFVVPLPPIDDQRAIAGLVSVINDRIELVRDMNFTLESVAQAIFKSWFIDFDPVRAKAEGREPVGMDADTAALFPGEFEESELGPIPTGWRVDSVGNVVQCVGGTTPSTKQPEYWEPGEFHWSTPKDLSGLPSSVLLTTERKVSAAGLQKISSGLLPEGTLLLSSRAPIGYLAIARVPTAINQGFIAMLPGGELPPDYLLFWTRFNLEAIKQKANGSTFMEISKAAFRPIRLVVPPPGVVSKFVEVAGVLLHKIAANEQYGRDLSELRDELLPRLVSGKLQISEAQRALEGALV